MIKKKKNYQQFNYKTKKFYKKKYNSFFKKLKKPKKPKITNYLYFNKRLKKGIFLKKPSFNDIKYPFFLNLKLINESLKKK